MNSKKANTGTITSHIETLIAIDALTTGLPDPVCGLFEVSVHQKDRDYKWLRELEQSHGVTGIRHHIGRDKARFVLTATVGRLSVTVYVDLDRTDSEAAAYETGDKSDSMAEVNTKFASFADMDRSRAGGFAVEVTT